MSLPPAPSCKHNDWQDITIHTAKCDICHQNNRTIMQRCRLCNMQFCRRCIASGQVQSTNHVMDQSKLDSETKAYNADPDPSPSTEKVQKAPRAKPKPASRATPSRKTPRTTRMEPPNRQAEETPTKKARTGINRQQPTQFSRQRPQMDDEEDYEEYNEEELMSRFPFSHQTSSNRQRPRPMRQHRQELHDEEYEEERFRVNRQRVSFNQQRPEQETIARHEYPAPRTGYPVPQTEYHIYPDGEFVQYETSLPPPSRPEKEQGKASRNVAWTDDDYDVATPKKDSHPKYTKDGKKLPPMPAYSMKFNIPKLPGKTKATKTNHQPPARTYEHDEQTRERPTLASDADRHIHQAVHEVAAPVGRVAPRPGRDEGFSRQEPQPSSRTSQQSVRQEHETHHNRPDTARVQQDRARIDQMLAEFGDDIDPAMLEELRGKSVEEIEDIITMAKILARR